MGFVDVLERFLPVTAFADAAGQAGHGGGKTALFAGFEHDSQGHAGRMRLKPCLIKAAPYSRLPPEPTLSGGQVRCQVQLGNEG